MDILLLGGQSPRHLEWSRALAEALESHGHHVARLVYANWLAGTRVIDIEAEVSAAAKLAGPLDRPVVVAKSIGTVIATLAIGRRLIQPAGEVFLGLPLEAFENDPEAVGYLPKLPPVTVVQNEDDPFGSAEKAREFVSAHAPRQWRFETIPAVNTHDYVDSDAIERWVEEHI